ncbi:MAG TPA: hypothetical protein VGP82_21160 [Ktedonobacterales bacterium]|nr:hypothetical protein [Ktedonobacterales bacterium]
MQESIGQPVVLAVELDMPSEPDDVEKLVLAERIAASMGAWFGGLLLRCAPPSGPFFTSDGRLAVHGTSFQTPPVS